MQKEEAKIALLQIFYEPQSILLTHYPVKVSHRTLEWREGGKEGEGGRESPLKLKASE